MLRRGLGDRDVDVRLAAIAGLGLIEQSNPDAKTELKQLTGNSAELIRAAAYEALLDSSDNLDELAAASNDKSWRMRRIAASALSSSRQGAIERHRRAPCCRRQC